MSHAQLYRTMLRQGKQLDAQPWRRACMLGHPSLLPYSAGLAASHGRGHALFFLQPHSSGPNDALSVQTMLKQQFRHEAWKSVDKQQSLSRGFEILRALRVVTESAGPAPIVNSSPNVSISSSSSASSSSSHSMPLTAVSGGRSLHRAPSTPSSSSSTAPSYSMPRPQQHRSSWLQANSGSSSSSSSSFNSSGSGAALHRVSQYASPSAHSSTLGRLIGDAVELQRPKTPPTGGNPAAVPAPADPNEDTQYKDAVFQMSVVASEYLKLVSAPVSAAARASGVPAAATAPIPTATVGSGVELFLLEQSRMKHQARRWDAEVLASLAPEQQLELQALIQRLGMAVEAGNMAEVLSFQTDLAASAPAPLARALYSNNAVLDAWVDCLFAAKQFRAAASLIPQRLRSGLSTQDYSLSRKTMCKLLTACAVEGNVSASLQVLRESSWGALALPGVAGEAHDAARFVPTSVSRLPSWVPQYYSSAAVLSSVAAAPRVEAEVEDAADGVLVAAGDGFGAAAVAPKAEPASPIIVAPVPHPRLSINVNATRAASSLPVHRVPTPQALSSLFVRGSYTPAGTSQSLAAMSTRASRSQQQVDEPVAAEAVAAAAVPAAVENAPPTPLPVIDLWTELSMDSRLLELAIVAAVRAESRSAEFALRDTVAGISAHAAANPASEHAALNLTMHEHALALLQQAQRSAAVSSAAAAAASDESDDVSAPPTVFEQMNDPKARSPLAFELYSLMLKQRVPLQHSHTYVQLMSQLRAHAASPSGLAAPQTVKTLLTTLSAEMAHSRSTGGPLQHRWVRGDVGAFRSSEFHLHHALSLSASDRDAGDSLFQAVDILREMHAESLPAPELSSVAALFSSVLLGAEQGFARSKAMQDLMCTVEDYAAIEPAMSVEALLQHIADGEGAAAASASPAL